jgi:hypothetical protein
MDVVSLATSAKRAGYQVYTVDFFGDQNLKRVCQKSRSIIKQRPGKTCGNLSTDFNPKALLQLTKDLLRKDKIDIALLSSGLDDFPEVLFELNELIPILGNPPNIIKRVRDKTKFFKELKRLQIRHPETAIAENFEEARKKSKDMGYPVVVKPLTSVGGASIRKVQNLQELEHAFRCTPLFHGKVLIQEYISGTPASVSLISSRRATIALTVNEQLLGISELGQQEPYGYCGNVIPLLADESVKNNCKGIAEKIALHFSLVGSNGLDLVISEESIPYAIEVNPRFQGTLECVERVLGMNIVKAHVKACTEGVLPTVIKKPSAFCVRLILFASRCSIVPDLSTFVEVRDIPLPGVVVEGGEPICSVVVEGVDRDSSLREAKKISGLIFRSLQSCD